MEIAVRDEVMTRIEQLISQFRNFLIFYYSLILHFSRQYSSKSALIKSDHRAHFYSLFGMSSALAPVLYT